MRHVLFSDVTWTKNPWCVPQNNVVMFLHMKLVLLGAVFRSSKCHIHEAEVGPDGTIQGNSNSVAVTLKWKDIVAVMYLQYSCSILCQNYIYCIYIHTHVVVGIKIFKNYIWQKMKKQILSAYTFQVLQDVDKSPSLLLPILHLLTTNRNEKESITTLNIFTNALGYCVITACFEQC